jgi:iron complex outermembrane receptor protein
VNKSQSIHRFLAGGSFAVLMAASGQAFAQAAHNTDLDEVVVTGSRVLGRTVETALAPIDVVSGEAIEQANKSNLLEQLGTTLPSFFVPNVATPNVGSMIRAGQLRGQNPGHTLVLVNGKRRHSTAFLGAGGYSAAAPVDLSMISSGAIKRIEVLRDGASALYGSDAIAGVINIITDDSDTGGEASYRYGRYFEGDGETSVVQLSQGFSFGDGGHLRLSGQRDSQKIVIRNSSVNPSLLYYFPISTITGQEVTPAGTLSTNPTLPASATPNPREATRDNNAWKNTGRAPYTLKSLAADIGHPLGDKAEAYGFFTYGNRSSAAPQNFRTPNRDEVVRAIYPDGYTPIEAIKENDYSGTGGIKGTDFHGWDWDLSSTYGRDSVDVYVHNSINASWGLSSPTDFYIGNHRYSAWTNNLDLRRSLSLFSISADLSAGLEYSREHYVLSPGDVAGYTYGVPGVNTAANPPRILDGPRAGTIISRSLGVSQALPAYGPGDAQDARRRSTSAYLGLALKPSDSWTVDLAVRGEDFSDFGRQATYRISSRYEFSPMYALRGTFSTGFHAPALAALSYQTVGNANTSTNYTLAVSSPEAKALGAQPLKPEKSVNYSLGLVAEPFWGLHLAVDAYRIDIDDRITQIASFNTAARPLGPAIGSPSLSEQLTDGRILRGDGISYFVNSSDQRTDGVEITAEKAFDFGADRQLRLSYAANFNRLKLTRIADAPPVLTAYGITLLDASAALNLKNSVPKNRQIFTANWRSGRFDISVRESYWGALRRSGTVNIPPTTGPYAGITQFDYDIGGLWTTDLNVTVKVNGRLDLVLSGSNIFQAKPTKTPDPLLPFQAIYAYQNNGAIGPEGGFWSTTVRYRF